MRRACTSISCVGDVDPNAKKGEKGKVCGKTSGGSSEVSGGGGSSGGSSGGGSGGDGAGGRLLEICHGCVCVCVCVCARARVAHTSSRYECSHLWG